MRIKNQKNILLVIALSSTIALFGQNQLSIPPTLSGTNFNLNVQNGVTQFYPGINTPTYGINGPLLAPTLIINKGDLVTLNVTNNLTGNGNSTTMHWHGLHVPAMDDGGPHQVILQGTTWSPKFKMLNNAGTFWYHPHGLGKTDLHVVKGLAGMIIVKDNAEALLNLPRTYGIDDFPIIIQTKAFDALNQVAIASNMDTALFVNGTLKPYLNVPSQVVRFRVLNGSSSRTYNLGLSNNQSFYQIATDGGLLDSSIKLTRLILSPGERAELLVNFTGKIGDKIFLESFSSELAIGIYGADSVGDVNNEIHDYEDNFLNGADFNILQFNVVVANSKPITAVIDNLVPYIPFKIADANKFRTFVFDTLRLLPIDPPNRADGPFGINNKTFDIDVANDTVHLNNTEVWTLKNKTLLAHPFHIHDIQFNVIEKNGKAPMRSERGWKDVILVMPNDSVKFITKFETFADNTTPYMYHCHILHHEDDGMMGSFLVIDTTASTSIADIDFENKFHVFPNPTNNFLNVIATDNRNFSLTIFNTLGKNIYSAQATSNLKLETSNFPIGIYFIQINSNNKIFTKKILIQ
jgi:blue copper oxidase